MLHPFFPHTISAKQETEQGCPECWGGRMVSSKHQRLDNILLLEVVSVVLKSQRWLGAEVIPVRPLALDLRGDPGRWGCPG